MVFKKRPHSISPADFDVRAMFKNLHSIDWSEHAVIKLSEGKATVTKDNRLTYSMATGTQPGEYPVDIEIYDSIAEMIQHPFPYDEL